MAPYQEKLFTEKTITDPEMSQQELALIRDRGYAVDNEEITQGIM
ncbi:IclR family transcriptional regulator C-terminal domain-containing protein [Thermodesulfobacteriota bacterium]